MPSQLQAVGDAMPQRASGLLSVLSLLSLAACVSTTPCPEGEVWNGSSCVPSVDTGPFDGGRDANGEDAPCGGGCTAPLVCNFDNNECVECLGTDASSCTEAGDNACVDSTCVACDDDADCEGLDAAQCNTTTNTCEACTSDAACVGRTGTEVCNAGTCVECTVATEAERCGANSCDPASSTCTTTARSSVRRCGACLADSECSQADDRCVPMEFMGSPRTGGFCLLRGSAGCTQPYTSPTPPRSSLSGAAAEVYCGIAEASTTCEAILDLVDNASCTTDDDCGAVGLADGQCETVNLVANKCTYACSSASQCLSGFMCPSMTYCGSS